MYLVSSEVQSLGECDIIKQKFGHSFQFSVLAVLSRLHQSISSEKEKIATEIEGIEKRRENVHDLSYQEADKRA